MDSTTVELEYGLARFRKLAELMKKTQGWGNEPSYSKIVDDLCVNTSKEAQDLREIMFRMIAVELDNKKSQKSK